MSSLSCGTSRSFFLLDKSVSLTHSDVEKITAKAKASLAKSQELTKAAMAGMAKMTPDDMQKIQAAVQVLEDGCPMMPALETANDALDDAFASLAKMGVPSAEGKAVRDELVKAALQLHTQMTECAECEGCEEGCEGCDEGMEEGEEEPVPAKTS